MTLGFEVEGEEFEEQDVVVSRSVGCSGPPYSCYLALSGMKNFS